MIKVKSLEKHYSNKFSKAFVLRNINIDIKQGEFVSIMGPSGSGKSTLLYILGMLDSEYQGEYFFNEEAVHKLNEKQLTELHKSKIGFVFQSFHLINELTVYENLEMPLLYQKVPGEERKSRIADLLDRFNIVAKKDLFPEQLSGGHQQLTAIARAIIGEPELILADEPTGNLHSDQGKEIMELLKNLNNKGKTIIQVTHSEFNASFGDRIIKLNDGWIEN
ncbi:MAG: ABC transporter ATP-binding protein [Ignavibacteriales bacterium]|nr:MAG: ABC transporter ATP-binding protein [Ignavibacteriales bacterium]